MSATLPQQLHRAALLSLGFCVIAIPLCLGGVPSVTIPLSLACTLVFCVCAAFGHDQLPALLRVWPSRLLLMSAAVGLALGVLALLPLGHSVVTGFLPEQGLGLGAARTTVGLEAWDRLSVDPHHTFVELLRALAMVLVFVCASRLRWTSAATLVTISACVVALVGLAHEAFGLELIYGSYRPLEAPAESRFLATGPFVNHNHQSGLILLGLLSALALALHLGLRRRDPQALIDDQGPAIAGDGLTLALCAAGLLLVDLWSLASRMALIVCLFLLPACLWLAQTSFARLRRSQGFAGSTGGGVLKRMVAGPPLLLWAVGLGLIAGLLGLLINESLLASLPGGSEYHSVERKLSEIRAAGAFIGQAPWIGLGRGSFAAWSGLVIPGSHGVRVHHIECWPVLVAVEFGLAFALVLVISLGSWVLWVWRKSDAAPRIALLGVLAVLLQNLADFSLEYGGVGSAMALLMGSLTGQTLRQGHFVMQPRASRNWWLTLIVLSALGFALYSSAQAPNLRERHQRAALGLEESRRTLEKRPLDANAWLRIAQAQLRAGQLTLAENSATLALRLDPGAADPRLLRASVRRGLGQAAAYRVDLRNGLERSPWPIPQELVQWLSSQHGPAGLATALLGPAGEAPPLSSARLLALTKGLAANAPDHAEALLRAARRQQSIPAGPEMAELHLQLSVLASRAGRQTLARHHTRQAIAQTPHDVALLVRYLQQSQPPGDVSSTTSNTDEVTATALTTALDLCLAALDSQALENPTALEFAVLRAFLQQPSAELRRRLTPHIQGLQARELSPANAEIRSKLLRSFAELDRRDAQPANR